MKKITLLLSFIACVLVSQAQTQVANIGALKTANASLAFGATSTATYTITGEVVVTFVSTPTVAAPALPVRTIYVQDATGGFMIYDSGKLFTSTPTLYSGLTGITGKVASYKGILELIPSVAPAAATSTNNTVVPIVSTLDNLINYPLQLCKVDGVMISDFVGYTTTANPPVTYTPNGTFQISKSFPLTFNGVTSTTVLFSKYSDTDYIDKNIPLTTAQNIIGLVLPYQSAATSTPIVDFIPRSLADFQAVTGLSSVSADKLEITLVGKKLNVTNVAEGSLVEVYSTLGAKVQSDNLTAGSIQLNDLAKGLYIVRIGKQTSKIML